MGASHYKILDLERSCHPAFLDEGMTKSSSSSSRETNQHVEGGLRFLWCVVHGEGKASAADLILVKYGYGDNTGSSTLAQTHYVNPDNALIAKRTCFLIDGDWSRDDAIWVPTFTPGAFYGLQTERADGGAIVTTQDVLGLGDGCCATLKKFSRGGGEPLFTRVEVVEVNERALQNLAAVILREDQRGPQLVLTVPSATVQPPLKISPSSDVTCVADGLVLSQEWADNQLTFKIVNPFLLDESFGTITTCLPSIQHDDGDSNLWVTDLEAENLDTVNLDDATNEKAKSHVIVLLLTRLARRAGCFHYRVDCFKSVARGTWETNFLAVESEIILNSGVGSGKVAYYLTKLGRILMVDSETYRTSCIEPPSTIGKYRQLCVLDGKLGLTALGLDMVEVYRLDGEVECKFKAAEGSWSLIAFLGIKQLTDAIKLQPSVTVLGRSLKVLRFQGSSDSFEVPLVADGKLFLLKYSHGDYLVVIALRERATEILGLLQLSFFSPAAALASD